MTTTWRTGDTRAAGVPAETVEDSWRVEGSTSTARGVSDPGPQGGAPRRRSSASSTRTSALRRTKFENMPSGCLPGRFLS